MIAQDTARHGPAHKRLIEKQINYPQHLTTKYKDLKIFNIHRLLYYIRRYVFTSAQTKWLLFIEIRKLSLEFKNTRCLTEGFIFIPNLSAITRAAFHVTPFTCI